MGKEKQYPAGFFRYLRENHHRLTPWYLAREWNSQFSPDSPGRVNRDHVRRCLEKLGLPAKAKSNLPTAEDVTASRNLQFDRVKKVREESERRRAAQRRERLVLRDSLLPTSDAEKIACPECKEVLLFTDQFFPKDGHGGLKRTRCIDCYNDVAFRARFSRSTLEREDKRKDEKASWFTTYLNKLRKEREEAEPQRLLILSQSPELGSQRCLKCDVEFPLNGEYYYSHKGDKKQYLDWLCKFCQREFRLRLQIAKARGDDTKSIKLERIALTDKANDLRREEHRLAALKVSEGQQGTKQLCSNCSGNFLLGPKYWIWREKLHGRVLPEPILLSDRCRFCEEQKNLELKRPKRNLSL